MSGTVKIEHEGHSTEVELKPCSVCGVLPTVEDAQKAVAHDRRTAKACAVCGKKSEMYPWHSLYHSVRCNGEGGFILCGTGTHDPTWKSDWVIMYSSGPGGVVDGSFHMACLKKIAPGIVIHKR